MHRRRLVYRPWRGSSRTGILTFVIASRPAVRLRGREAAVTPPQADRAVSGSAICSRR